MSSGRVVLAATPIGNVADASPRLVAALAEADVVAAEDTRRLLALARRLGVSPRRVVSHHEHNEAERVEELLAVVRDGGTVLVVSDAGMPAVSDPGFALVRAAAAEGLTVTVVPGPSAVLAALAVSGLPTDRFTFEGFLPRRAGERARAVAALAGERRRPAAVCRELTKTYEEVRRGTLGELAAWAADGHVRGEVAVVVGGAPDQGPPAVDDLVAEVLARADAGERLKDAAAAVAAATGAAKRALYEAALARRRG